MLNVRWTPHKNGCYVFTGLWHYVRKFLIHLIVIIYGAALVAMKQSCTECFLREGDKLLGHSARKKVGTEFVS